MEHATFIDLKLTSENASNLLVYFSSAEASTRYYCRRNVALKTVQTIVDIGVNNPAHDA